MRYEAVVCILLISMYPASTAFLLLEFLDMTSGTGTFAALLVRKQSALESTTVECYTTN